MKFPEELEAVTLKAMDGQRLTVLEAAQLANGLIVVTGHQLAECAQCSTAFITVKPSQVFCSKQCNWNYWNAKKMERYHKKKKRLK